MDYVLYGCRHVLNSAIENKNQEIFSLENEYQHVSKFRGKLPYWFMYQNNRP